MVACEHDRLVVQALTPGSHPAEHNGDEILVDWSSGFFDTPIVEGINCEMCGEHLDPDEFELR